MVTNCDFKEIYPNFKVTSKFQVVEKTGIIIV